MATRINKPFVLGLIAVLVALVLGVIGFYNLFVQRDATELARRAQALMDADEPRQALHYLGSALRQDRTNPALIDLYLQALEHAVVDDPLTARTHVEQMRRWKQRVAALRPDEPRRLADFYAFELRLAEELGDREAHDRLHALTADRLAARPDDPFALKYHGIASVHRLTADTPSRQRREALETLEAARAEVADDPELLHYQARWHLFEADLARRAREHERAAELRAEARQLSRAALEAAAADVDGQLRHLHVLVRIGDDEAHREARGLVDVVLEQFAEAPAPVDAMVNIADLLPRLDHQRVEPSDAELDRPVTRGVQRARELLETVLASHGTDEAPLLGTLGRLRALTGDHDGAIEAYEAMRRETQRGPAKAYLRDRAVRHRGTIELADLLLARADGDDNPDRRERTLERVASLIDEVEQSAGDVDELAKLRGKLAMLRGHVSEAAMHLDRAVDRLDAPPPSVLVLSSEAHRQLGNWGTAAGRLERLLETHGELAQIRLDLAELLLEGGRLSDAERHIQTLIADHPRHAEPRRLHVRLLAERGRLDEAVALYRLLPERIQSALLRPLTAAHVAAGQADEALALLERRLADDPTDLRAVHLLARLAPEAPRTRDALARARDGGADDVALRMIERQLDPGAGDAIGDGLLTLLEDEPDEAEPALPRVLLKVQLAQRRGDTEALRAAIDEAAAIDPEHPHVIGLRFELALHDREWPLAERLATEAQRRDLDLAGGAFFLGRLAAARGELAEATAHYRRGLGRRRVHAEGWRHFGDVLLRRDDLTAAIDAYRRAIEQQPDNVNAHRGLAVALDQRNEPEAALEHLREAVRHAPADEALFEHYARYEQRFGEPERVATLRRQRARTHPHAAANRRALAAKAVGRGDLEAAAAHYEHVVRGHDASARVTPSADFADDAPLERFDDLLTLASIQLQLNEPGRVIELLDDERLGDAHAPLQARRARALAMLERDDEAAAAFDRALAAARSPTQVKDVATQRAAVAGVSRVLDWLEPTDPEATTQADAKAPALWRAMGAAGLEIQVNRLVPAIRRLEPWLARLEQAEREPDAQAEETAATQDDAELDEAVRWSFYRLLAQAHHRLGAEPAAAAAAYERMLALRPEHLVTLNDLAYLLADELGEPERALPLAERAAAMAPENARVLDTLGWAQYRAGQIEAARRTLERAVALEPVPEAHLHLGVVYAALEQAGPAREQFEQARELAERANHQTVLAEARRHLEGQLRRSEP